MLKLKASLPFSSAPASYSTPPPLESAQLVALADRRTAGVALQAALLSHIETQGKLRELGNGAKGVTLELIGRALQSGGGNASPHLKTMAHMGTAWVQLSVLQRDHLDRLTVTCLASLEQFNSSQKDLERTLKEAERRRGVLESLLGKAEKKGQKLKPELEEELMSARVQYEDSSITLERKAMALTDAIPRETRNLEDLLEAEIDYATAYLARLQACKTSLPSSRPTTSSLLSPPPATTRMARSHSDSAALPKPDFSNTVRAAPGERRRTVTSSGRSTPVPGGFSTAKEEDKKGRSRSGSLLSRLVGKGDKSESPGREREEEGMSFSRPSLPTLNSIKKLATSSPKYNSLADPPSPIEPTPPSPIQQPRFARAQTLPSPSSANPPLDRLYAPTWDFVTTAQDELTLHKNRGVVVRVERMVNSDWWIGSVVKADDPSTVGAKGLFPSAYVEPVLSAGEGEGREGSIRSFQSFEGDRSSSNGHGYDLDADSSEEGFSAILRPHNSSSPLDNEIPSYESQGASHRKAYMASPVAKRAPPPPPAKKQSSNGGASPFG